MPHKVALDLWEGCFLNCRLITAFSNDAEEIIPDRPTVLWVHPIMADVSFWAGNMTGQLRAYNHILIDILGHGASVTDLPETFRKTTPVDAFQPIWNHFNIKEAHVVTAGVSAGPICQFPLEHPERVLSFTVVGLYLKDENSSGIDEDIKETIELLLDELTTPVSVRTKATFLAFTGLVELHFGGDYFKRPFVTLATGTNRKWAKRVVEQHGREQFFRSTVPFLTADTRLPLHQLTCPILIIRGEEDRQTPESLFKSYVEDQTSQSLFDNIKVNIIPDAPYLCCATHPEEFNKLLLSNLSTAPSLPLDYEEPPTPWLKELKECLADRYRIRPVHLATDAILDEEEEPSQEEIVVSVEVELKQIEDRMVKAKLD